MGVHAKAPTRATNNITLTFGLLPIPVQLFKATEDTKAVERKQFSRSTGNPVGTQPIDKVTRKPVANDDIVYKAEVGDKWVELTDDELASVTAGSAVEKGNVGIDAFVPLDAIGDLYLLDTSRLYQARPAPTESGRKKMPNPHAIKAFALLCAVLRKQKAAALFHVGLRSTARYAVLTPDGYVRFLFFDEEVRQERELDEVEITDAEMGMAMTLIGDALETPELVDDARAKIAEFLATKAEDTNATPIVDAPASEDAPLIDFTAALEASVNAARAAEEAEAA